MVNGGLAMTDLDCDDGLGHSLDEWWVVAKNGPGSDSLVSEVDTDCCAVVVGNVA